MKYIKRVDAINAVANTYWQGTDCECYAFAHKALDNVPNADVAPVKHGRWIKNDPHCDGLAFLWNCSECGEESDEGYRYCPACGARMDGENDEIDRR